MSLFGNMLGATESIFADEVALSYDYIPKLVPYREAQQRQLASCIKPLFAKRTGRNLVIWGPPGVGKTVATKHVMKELEEETSEIAILYINCWQKNTTFKVICEMAELLDYKFTHNKKTDELFRVILHMLNKTSVVFVFDEADKLEEFDFLYMILEQVYRKSIVIITNEKEVIEDLDQRIKSRLVPEMCSFLPYNIHEARGIIKERIKYAFIPNAVNDQVLEMAVETATKKKDMRIGLYLLKEAGNIAEERASRMISVEDAAKAIAKLEEFARKDVDELEGETKIILDLIRENPQTKIGDIHRLYQEKGGAKSYKPFQRRIKRLEADGFISCEKRSGDGGNTSILQIANTEKKLTDFSTL